MKCPNCNGSGTIKEYDYDRYYLHTCNQCDGSGEQRTSGMTVKQLIEKLSKEHPDAIVKMVYDCEQQIGYDDIAFVGRSNYLTYFNTRVVILEGVEL
jgi:ssDNA-binding Zn-finger/Zn-ribbon topoisomerase 1